MDHGNVIAELLSAEGVKQGDVLASLLFALSMKDLYADSIVGLDCKAVAIMDDIYFFVPPLMPLLDFVRF